MRPPNTIEETVPLPENAAKVRAAQVHAPIGPRLNPNFAPSPASIKPSPAASALKVVSVPELTQDGCGGEGNPAASILADARPGVAVFQAGRREDIYFPWDFYCRSEWLAVSEMEAPQSAQGILRGRGDAAIRTQAASHGHWRGFRFPDATGQFANHHAGSAGPRHAGFSTISGQDEIEAHLDGVSLLVLDNLSALVRAVKENEGEGWLPVQDWALDLRRRGIAVLFVHHAGKGGAQRGTSRREDLLDSVLTLKHPSDYHAEEGLRCIVDYEKSRGFYGVDARSFEVKMSAGPSGESVWTVADCEASTDARASKMFQDGMSIRDVAEELGISRSKAHRLKNALWRAAVPSPER